jgi:hypothetical protein
MVALEAWALGRPVLANASCDVLHGQCLRSNAGLFYSGFREFFETLRTLDGTPSLAAALGQNGRQYFDRHYSWPVIERKYIDMLERLSREPSSREMEPIPGWWAQRRRELEPADAVVARLPKGAATEISDRPAAHANVTGGGIERPGVSQARTTAAPASATPPAARHQAGDRNRGDRPALATARPPRGPAGGDRREQARRRHARGRRRSPGGR